MLCYLFFCGALVLAVQGKPTTEGGEPGTNDSKKDKDKEFTVDQCIVGGYTLDFNNVAGAEEMSVDLSMVYIFPQYEVACDGKVSRWEFNAVNAGVFTIAVVRPLRSKKQLHLVGYNTIKTETTGVQIYEVPMDSRIAVTAGDLLAVAWNPDLTSGPVVGMAIVDHVLRASQHAVRKTKLFTLSAKLPKKAEVENFVTDFPHLHYGHDYSVALSGHVVGKPSSLRLAGREDKPEEGVAEIFKDGMWGSICDEWYHVLGWPNYFCKTLGYPTSTFAHYKTHHEVYEDYQPNYMDNLRCKATGQQASFFSCDLHPGKKCDHKKDLYVVCAKKVRLIGGNDRCKGLASIWEEGYWGMVCDDRENAPEWHMTHQNVSWTAAFCSELGCGVTATRVSYARDQVENYTPPQNPNYPAPTCNVPNPKNMNECPRRVGKMCAKDQSYDLYLECGNNSQP